MNNDRFSQLRFPVHQHEPEYDLSQEARFRVLFNYPEFKAFAAEDPEKVKYKNKLVRYICFLYDPKSELIQEFSNLTERKETAAIEAGFARNRKEEWPKRVQAFFDFEDHEMLGMVLRFLKTFKSHLWTEICTQEHELEKYTALRWTLNTKEAQNLGQVCAKIRESLEENKKAFFDGDKSLEEAIEMITPENAHLIIQPSLEDVSSD